MVLCERRSGMHVVQKVVQKFRAFEEAEEAEYAYYKALSEDEKLQLLLELILPEEPNAAVIERSARVHPRTEHEACSVLHQSGAFDPE